jgi:hypothetical protein
MIGTFLEDKCLTKADTAFHHHDQPCMFFHQTTPGLFECPPHHAMELLLIATYCSILQNSAQKQEHARTVSSHPPPWAKCKMPVQHHFSTSKLLSWLSSLSPCFLMLVDHMQHPATCGN